MFLQRIGVIVAYCLGSCAADGVVMLYDAKSVEEAGVGFEDFLDLGSGSLLVENFGGVELILRMESR